MTDYDRPDLDPTRRPTATTDAEARRRRRAPIDTADVADARRRPTAAGTRRQPRPLGGRGRSASSRSSSVSRAAAHAAPDRRVPGRDGRRLRAGGQRRVRRDAPGPAGRPAPADRRIPHQVPGFRRPGRTRDQDRRGARSAVGRGHASGKQTYTKDIKPWFEGEVAFAVGPLPDGSRCHGSRGRASAGRSSSCRSRTRRWPRAWFDEVAHRDGVTNDRDVPAPSSPSSPTPTSAGPRPRWRSSTARSRIVGDIASVKAAIDTNGGSALAKGDPRRGQGRARKATTWASCTSTCARSSTPPWL